MVPSDDPASDHLLFPGLVLHNPIWGGGEAGRFLAAAVSFIINYACYFSEIYRGGIQGVPEGQKEAGLVLGMTKHQIFFKITLLQMIKRVVPPMSNEIITLVKDTSLARIIAAYELTFCRCCVYEVGRTDLATVLHWRILSDFYRYSDAFVWLH